MLVCGLLTVSAMTAAAMTADQENLGAFCGGAKYAYISSFPISFSIGSGGMATMTAYVSARNVDSCKLTIYLQKYENGTWVAVKKWSGSNADLSCILKQTYYVQSGYSYRMKAYANVYINDVVVEGDMIISQTEIY